MWKSKYKCFVIKSRYVCSKDNDLAKVYSSAKKAIHYHNADNIFEILLKEIIDNLVTFARHRGLLDESLFISVHKTLTLGYDTYQLSDDDFEMVRKMLIDCIYNFQELEELADNVSPLVNANDETEEYDSCATYKEIKIRVIHVTRDMSVGNTYDVDYYDDIDQFDNKKERRICPDHLDGEGVRLISVTEKAVTLSWGEEEFHVNFETEVSTEEHLINNPLLSSDSLKLTFTYRHIPSYAELWNMIASLGCDELDEKEERHILTARKKDILHFIDKLIEQGYTGLYVAKALLTEYNNWGTCKINNLNFFRQQLLEGIERGSLAPDNYFGWEWMEVATKYNAPTDFMEDMELYYEVLDTAACHGVVEAIDIMDSIWEPEQIIEED